MIDLRSDHKRAAEMASDDVDSGTQINLGGACKSK